MIKTKLSPINNFLTKFGFVLVIKFPSDMDKSPTELWIERFSAFQKWCQAQNKNTRFIKTP